MSAQQVLSAEASRAAGLSAAAGGVSAPQPPHTNPERGDDPEQACIPVGAPDGLTHMAGDVAAPQPPHPIPAPAGLLPPGNNRVAPSDPDAGSGQHHARNWTADDIARLRAAWVDLTIARADLPAHMGRTMHAIEHMVWVLKLGERPGRAVSRPDAWTDEEIATLREMWPNHTRQEIANKLERSYNSVSKKACTLRISTSASREYQEGRRLAQSREALARAREVYAAQVRKSGTEWFRTPDRRAILERDWPTYRPAHEIAAEMNGHPGREIRVAHLSSWAKDLKLRRPEDFRPKRDPEAKAHALKIEKREKPVWIARKCLCCGVGFDAETRFIRLCQRCRHQSEGLV